MSHFTFGGIKSSDKHIRTLTEIIRPMQAGSRDSLTEIAGMDGSYYFGADLTEATIRVRGYSKASSMSNRIEIVRNLQKWLVGADLQQLTFSDEEDKYYMVKLTGEITPLIQGLFIFWDLSFLAPDPCAHAVDTKTVIFPLPEKNGERNGNDDPLENVNEGSLPCPCIITATMTGSASDLKITLAETEEYFILDHDLRQGDTVVIDTGRRLATLNSVDARTYVTVQSIYFNLPVGEFNFTTEEAVTISVEYRERWA